MKFKNIISTLLISVSFVLAIILIASAGMMPFKNRPELAAPISAAAQVIYLACALIVLKIKKIDIRKRCRIVSVPAKQYILPCLTAFLMSFVTELLRSLLPISKSNYFVTEAVAEAPIALMILSVLIIAPITEEFVFRGLILNKLLNSFGLTVSVAVSTCLFSLVHLMTGDPLTAVSAVFTGAIFGVCFAKTGSLLPAVAAHIFANLAGFIKF